MTLQPMKIVPLFLAIAISLSGCSMLTKSGRQQHAYDKYVRKSSIARTKQQARFRTGKPQMRSTPLVEPGETVEASSGPESVTEAPGSQ